MRYRLACLSLLIFVLLAAAPLLSLEAREYVLGPGDELTVTVPNHPELTQTVRVMPDGSLSLQYIGRVVVEGLTDHMLERILEERYSEYYVSPRINVTVTRFRVSQVKVMGEVSRPGIYDFETWREGELRVSEVVLQAGGTTAHADLERIQVLRSKGGTVQSLVFDMEEYLRTGSNERDYFLRDGDVILVPETTKGVLVVGEVSRPGLYPIREGATIMEIIASAGWHTRDADIRNVIHTRMIDGVADIRTVDMDSIMNDRDPEENIGLESGDMVFVPEKTGVDTAGVLSFLSIVNIIKDLLFSW